MQGHSELVSIDEERDELEAVAEALGRSSRLSSLLLYIGEKYFRGESGELTEYNLATEVFGRSKTAFDAGEDAIVRVEAHRLRRRLKEFYESTGKDRPIQLSIPPRSYVPTFTRKTVGFALPSAMHGDLGNGDSATLAAPSNHAHLNESTVAEVSPPARNRNWMFAFLALGLVGAAVAAIALYRHAHKSVSANAMKGVAGSAIAPQTPSFVPAQVPLRILAGYSGEPQTDSAAAVWQADRYVNGGGPWHRPETAIARTSDPLLFQNWRTGDSFYDIPLLPGVYELHLYFITSDRSSDSLSTFTVRINGDLVLRGFDINSDALGENIADERVFRDVSPASDGMLHLSFTSERGAPQINAIEVLPGLPHKLVPIRLVMQRTSFTDHLGQLWHPDNYYMNGRLSDQRQQVSGSPDPDLFATERYGHFTYALPVDPRDRYTLVLHFAEFYFGPQAPGGGGTGRRIFRVMCNGETLLDNFDIYKEAGSLHALTKIFYHLKSSAQGKLNLTFEPITNNATISGIEVLDESQ